MISEHAATRLTAVKERFGLIRRTVDQKFPGGAKFANTHSVEAYKALLKAHAVLDETIVTTVVAQCKEVFAGQPILVYPMLHLAGDTNEYGTWHRDGKSHTQRVFWLPMTAYDYPGISLSLIHI